MRNGPVDSSAVESDRVNVGVAEYCVTRNGVSLNTSGLGSCLAVALYDEDSGVAGLGHFMLPSKPEGSDDDESKFVVEGTEALLAEMERQGADRENVVAKIAGGGTLLSKTGDEPIGPQNVDTARRTFRELDVPIVAEDVGDDYGRSIRFDPETGEMTVIGAHTDTVRL